jgi:hypothetical protein
MYLLNATPHPITLLLGDTSIVLPPSGIVTRISTVRECVDVLPLAGQELPLNVVKSGKTLDLPEPREDVVVIVSRMVAHAHPSRRDLFFPDGLERDESGSVIGCHALGSLWRSPLLA